MSAALDRLTASLANNSSATASAIALLSTLASEIRAGLVNDDAAALNALADKLDAENASIADAVTANTVAEGDGSGVVNEDPSAEDNSTPSESTVPPVATDPASATDPLTPPLAPPPPSE